MTASLVDRQALQAYVDAIRDEDGGAPYMSGQFEAVIGSLIVDRAMTSTTSPVLEPLLAVTGRVGHARTVVGKIEWLRGQRDTGNLDPYSWMFYAASDVVAFHAFVRGVFDDLARAVVLVADKPGQCSQGSFRELRHWLKKSDGNVVRLGPDLATVVVECDWFDTVRAVRDQLIHLDVQAIVFPEEPGIKFQVYDGVNGLDLDEALHSPDSKVVDFAAYSSAVLAGMHTLIEDVSRLLAQRVGVEPRQPPGRSQHPALRVSKAWASDLLHAVGSR